ncbi:hypothetical protein Ntsu_31350 [Nocardia sp. IFM 10818]
MLPLLEPAHLDRDFDYLVPPEMDADAQPGVRVRVRFSGRLVDGYLLERLETTTHTGKLMPLDRVVSPERVLTPEILRLITAVAARYAGTRADVLRLAIPPRHAKVETEGQTKPPAKPKSRRKKATGNTELQAIPPTPASDPLAPEDPSPASSTAAAPDTADAPSRDAPAAEPGVAAEHVSPEILGSEAVGGAAATAAQVPASTENRASEGDSVAHEPAAGATEGASRANLARESGAVADGARGAIAGTTGSADMRRGAEAAAALVVEVNAAGGGSATHAPHMSLAGGDSAEPTVAAAADRSTDAVADGAGSVADGDEPGGDAAAGSGVAPARTSETLNSDVAASKARPEDFPAWGRYVHGRSFLGALAAGRGPRAAWQALPGEDWARRLAEMAAVVVGGGRSAVLMVPDQRDLDRVLGECVALVGESAVGLAAGLGPSARYRRWLAALRGTARIVVGTRSSVFAPVKDLGLIAIWDDGDDTFAEPRAPYPHAREVAMLRAHETGAAFVAGGFARTAEVQAIVESGWAHDLLADRADLRAVMPRIKAPGDTDVALERDPIAKAVRIPGEAFMAAKRALAEGAPVLVQVPRRGYIPALSCAKCRTPARCRHCNGPLALPDNGSKPSPPRSNNGGTGAPGSTRGGGAGRSSVGDGDRRFAGGDGAGRSAGGDGARRSAREVGVAASVARGGAEVAHSPTCRWCGKTEPAFRCGACGSRALRAVVIGAARTAEELGRAFPGVPVRGSGGGNVLSEVPPGPQVVVATIGAEPTVPGGYGVALLLDGWALLGRADLRAAEDTLRRWMSATALVRPKGQALVMAEPTLPTVQALLRWDPVWHAQIELSGRTEVRFPPAVRLAAIDGTTDSIAELLTEAKLPDFVEVLGPVPLPFGARKPFSGGDSPAEVERMILRVDRSAGSALARALTAAQAVRSTHKSDDPLRVQIDPIDIG